MRCFFPPYFCWCNAFWGWFWGFPSPRALCSTFASLLKHSHADCSGCSSFLPHAAATSPQEEVGTERLVCVSHFLAVTCGTLLVCSCGRPYIKLSHGEGSLDKGDRIPRSGTCLVSSVWFFYFHHFKVVGEKQAWTESACLFESRVLKKTEQKTPQTIKLARH